MRCCVSACVYVPFYNKAKKIVIQFFITQFKSMLSYCSKKKISVLT